MNIPTREEIALAFLSMMDGLNDHDIQAQTGFPEEECQKIIEIRRLLQEEMPDWYKRDI